jgi:hypothetical protein
MTSRQGTPAISTVADQYPALARWQEVDARAEASEAWWTCQVGPQPVVSDDDLRLDRAALNAEYKL